MASPINIAKTASVQERFEKADRKVRKYYPSAMRQEDVAAAAMTLTQLQGMAEDNTLFAHSVCPDEINHDDGDITDCLRDHFNGVFSLGGLGGIPFTGKTGFAAYAAHVPDSGNIFVLFAPHVAISEEGKIGYYHRRGQAELSTACGAAIGAYNAVKDLPQPPVVDGKSHDSQMEYIKRLIWNNKDRVAEAQNSTAEVSHILFEHIRDYIIDIVDKKYVGSGKIAILGGIQINVAHHDYFMPEMFVIMDREGTHDFLPQLKAFDKVNPELMK